MSIPEPHEPHRIRRLLVQPGMLLLFLVVCLGWTAAAVWGEGGLLADVAMSQSALTPISGGGAIEPADSGAFGTLTVSTPRVPATQRPEATATSEATAAASGRLSDFLNGTRTP